jgi:anti-sigma factor ChrR (cupin superfamily)
MQKPSIGVYHGSGNLPPGEPGMIVGLGHWLKIGDKWFRITGVNGDINVNMHRIRTAIEGVLDLEEYKTR